MEKIGIYEQLITQVIEQNHLVICTRTRQMRKWPNHGFYKLWRGDIPKPHRQPTDEHHVGVDEPNAK